MIGSFKNSEGKSISPNTELPNHFFTLKSIQIRFQNLEVIIYSLLNIKLTDNIPTSLIIFLNTNLSNLKNSVESTATQLAVNHADYQLSLATLIATNKSNSQQINIEALLVDINAHIDTCTIHANSILLPTKTEKNDVYSNIILSLVEHKTKSDLLIETINNNETHSKKLLESCITLEKAISQSQTTSQTNATTISEHLENTTACLKHATKNQDEIGKILTKSKLLQQKVTNYEDSFNNFDAKLKKRNDEFIKSSDDITRITYSIASKEQEISDMLSRAESLLSGATNAALASGFHKIMSKIETRLSKARNHFYISIFILIISSSPLALHLFLSTMKHISPQLQTSENVIIQLLTSNISFSSVISYLLIIAPGFWLTKFAASRHSALFRLHEDYAYKYSIAMGVEGYKKEAPSYKDEIAAATFFEIAFNPADNIDKDHCETKHPNPILDYIMDKMGVNKDGKPSKKKNEIISKATSKQQDSE